MGFITSTDADVYGAYGAWDYEGGALNNPGPKDLLAKYQAAVAAGKSGNRLKAMIDKRSQAFLERAAERIESGTSGAKKRFRMWNKARRSAGLSPLSLDGVGAWDYEGGALNNPSMSHAQNRRQRGQRPAGHGGMKRGGNRRRRSGAPGGKKLPLAQAYSQCLASKSESECEWIKTKLEAAGGSAEAIENPRKWRSRRKLKKQLKKVRRKNRRLRKGGGRRVGPAQLAARAARRQAAMQRRAIQVQQAGTPQTMSLEQGGQPPQMRRRAGPAMRHAQNRRLRGATADQAANMELAGILGFGIDHAGQARTNALQILDLGFGAITEEAYLDDYGDYKARQKRRKKRIAKRSKRAKKRGKTIAARQKGRAEVRSARKEYRSQRQANLKARLGMG